MSVLYFLLSAIVSNSTCVQDCTEGNSKILLLYHLFALVKIDNLIEEIQLSAFQAKIHHDSDDYGILIWLHIKKSCSNTSFDSEHVCDGHDCICCLQWDVLDIPSDFHTPNCESHKCFLTSQNVPSLLLLLHLF